MSDDAGTESKKRRGRPAKVETGGGADVKPKVEKRARTDGESGPPAKKGRGRPKGTGGGRRRKGRKSPAKKATTAGRGGGRGRPKKAAAPAEEPDKSEQSSGAEQGEDE